MGACVHILILAAGASSRMRGVDKLVQPVMDKPLLRHIAETALATGAPVSVTLPLNASARKTALEGLPLNLIPVPDADQGMSRSLVRGLLALRETGPEDGVMILPADMPDFTPVALLTLIDQFRADPTMILRGGTPEGTPGHPAIFPRDLWPALAAVTGDEGGRSVIRTHAERIRLIPLPGTMATRDLDTPEDWADWRGRP